MDGLVFGCLAAVFGTVRQQIAQKTVGRYAEAMRWMAWMECQAGQNVNGVYFGSTRQRRIWDSLRWRTL